MEVDLLEQPIFTVLNLDFFKDDNGPPLNSMSGGSMVPEIEPECIR